MQVQSTGELFKLWREGKVPLLMVAYSWMLGQVGDALGVQPGEEFRVALMEAQKVGDIVQTHLLQQLDCDRASYMDELGSAAWESATRGTADESHSVTNL